MRSSYPGDPNHMDIAEELIRNITRTMSPWAGWSFAYHAALIHERECFQQVKGYHNPDYPESAEYTAMRLQRWKDARAQVRTLYKERPKDREGLRIEWNREWGERREPDDGKDVIPDGRTR